MSIEFSIRSCFNKLGSIGTATILDDTRLLEPKPQLVDPVTVTTSRP